MRTIIVRIRTICQAAAGGGAAGGLRAGFEGGEAGFEGFQPGARVGEHFALHLEFLAADEIETGEEAVQERPGVLLQRRPRPACGETGEAGGEFIEEFWVEHGVPEGTVAIEFSTQAGLHQLSAGPPCGATYWCAGFTRIPQLFSNYLIIQI